MTAADPYQPYAAWYDWLFEKPAGGLWRIGLSMSPPQRGMRVLDIGCGTGAQLRLYQKAGCRVFGIDRSPAMLDQARKRLGAGACLCIADAVDPPLADKSFDRILFSLVLHEMSPKTRQDALNSAKTLLKDNGRLVLIDFHPGPLRGVKGRVVKSMVLVIELAAGIRHFTNHLHFVANNGITGLVAGAGLEVEKRKIVSGGNLAVFLVRMNPLRTGW